MPEIESKSIYHGLPVFSRDIKRLTAIVTGASGISGYQQLRVLCETPRRWQKIYALSRRPPHGSWPDHVEHVPIDLLQSPETIAAELSARGVRADYAFCFAYIKSAPKEGGLCSAEEEMVAINREFSVGSSSYLRQNNDLVHREATFELPRGFRVEQYNPQASVVTAWIQALQCTLWARELSPRGVSTSRPSRTKLLL
jgi:hypothetical protein